MLAGMPIFSLVHTKGGVAKTTSAVYLATAAARRGVDVVLVDADPQGSALEWAADAAADPLPFPVVPAPRPLVVDTDRELTIVDTPPGTAQVIQEAIDVADLVIVPTGVSPLDVRRVWPTLEITAHRPTAVLLTGVDLRTRLAEEVRALTVGTDNAGGYLAPEQFVRELDRNLVLFSPIRSVARVSQAASGELILPKRTGQLSASWGDESDDATATQPTYGQTTMNVFEMKCFIDVSNRLLEDAAFNIEAELSFDLAEEFGRAEGAAFVAGNGTKKPLGLISTTGIANVTTAAATDIDPDELIDLYHALPGAYAARAVWGMNRTTMGKVRKMKDGEGRYIWQEPLSQGNPATILGRPVLELPDMPDVAAGAIPVVFGDFGSGYRIFDRVNLSVLRDPYSQQVSGLVRFHARRRVGGGVTKTEAFKCLKMHAA